MKKQQGLTLIELMISLALGMIIIAATLSVYINTIKSSGDTIKSARLNHDLGMAMSLISNDIKRAGYWGGAVVSSNSLTNPFTTATSLSIGNSVGTNDCLLYTYDANSNGALDANEYYGFRLYTALNGNRTIQIKSTNVACNDATAAWASITDENMINITNLRFSFLSLDVADGSSPCTNTALTTCLTATSRCTDFTTTATPNTNATIDCKGLTFTPALANPATTTNPAHSIAVKRVINIRMTGQLIGADNAEVTKSLSGSVALRNNRIYTITVAP